MGSTMHDHVTFRLLIWTQMIENFKRSLYGWLTLIFHGVCFVYGICLGRMKGLLLGIIRMLGVETLGQVICTCSKSVSSFTQFWSFQRIFFYRWILDLDGLSDSSLFSNNLRVWNHCLALLLVLNGHICQKSNWIGFRHVQWFRLKIKSRLLQ